MLYEIMLSLRLYLSEEFPELSDVQFMYEGVKISGKEKPFLTMEDLATPSQLLSAGQKSYDETYVLQIGLYARNYGERLKLQSRITESLRKAIPMYNDSFELTGESFVCDVNDFTTIGNDDLANVTNNFHGYFDVSVELLRDVGSKEFTQ